MTALPLQGVKVLDMTQFLSGPYCTQMLADLGADVIKLESPEGDLARHIPPHYVGEDSVYYLSINRNKESVAVDLKTEGGLDVARRLIEAADVVVENFRPGVLDRLGLAHSAFRQTLPRLIWCSISGFGQNGPYRDKPAYDMIVQALSGGMSLTGEPGRGAVRAGIPLGDLSAGMYAASGILAALVKLGKTGEGDYIDISMLDCQAAMLCYQGAYFLHSAKVPGRQGAGHDSIVTYRSFTAKDKVEVVITANTERMWQGLCRVLGVAELIDDARFINGKARYEHRFELWPLLEAAFLKHTADEWVPLLEAESIPTGVVNTLDRVAADPQIAARGMVQHITADDGRELRVMADPMRFGSFSRPEGTFPPRLGEQSREILAQVLGFNAGQIDALFAAGAVSEPRTLQAVE